MNHFGKLTTLAAAGAVAIGLLFVPAGAGASSTTTTTTPPTSTTKPTTTPTATKATTTTTATTGHWTVLVASFATKPEAATQLAQLRKLGFTHFHVVHTTSHYVVRERHLHHATATKLVAKLKAAGISASVQP